MARIVKSKLISTATFSTELVPVKIGKENQRLHFQGSSAINENIAMNSQLVHPSLNKTAGKMFCFGLMVNSIKRFI